MIGFSEFLMMLAGSTPALILWIAVIIFAVVMLRRGGGRAERFLIAGASLKIISNLLGIITPAIMIWLLDAGYSKNYANSIASGYGIFLNIIGMAGIICLVYAFWVKFKTKNFGKEAALPQD
jgi:hypothetical protein